MLHHVTQTLFGPGLTARLLPAGRRCRLELVCDGPPAGEIECPLHCHILWQPRDRAGLASGTPVRLGSEPLLLRLDPSNQVWVGSCWLPEGVDFSVARQCYYRLN